MYSWWYMSYISLDSLTLLVFSSDIFLRFNNKIKHYFATNASNYGFFTEIKKVCVWL